MNTTAPPPPGHRTAKANAPNVDVSSLIRTDEPPKTGPRIYLYGIPGFGKTTLGAFAPKPLFILAEGEDGLLTLIQAGRVPNVPRAQPKDWNELLGLVEWVAAHSGDYETLVLDGATGFEAMCHAHVCLTVYDGDWGESGFGAWKRGYETSVREWGRLLALLDRVHAKGITVILIGHSEVRRHTEPLGKDFDAWTTVLHRKTWAATTPWADAVIFGTTVSVTNKDGKGIGGTQRVLMTQHRDGHEAKNRYGMPEQIDLPDDPAQNWPALRAAIEGDA